MRKRVYEKSWGGRGEHGFRYFDYERSNDELTIYITVKDYNDWGQSSSIQKDYEKQMAFPINGVSFTKDFVFECIIKAGNELNETYLLPKSADELKM